jgi:hypothetical protein
VDDAAAAAAACACALSMLRLEALSPGSGEPPVSLHIALHAGALSEFHIGNGDVPGGRWEHMVTGAPLTELAPLVAAAAPGECVGSHALWALLRGRGGSGSSGSSAGGGSDSDDSGSGGDDAAAAHAAAGVLRGAPCVGGARLLCAAPPPFDDDCGGSVAGSSPHGCIDHHALRRASSPALADVDTDALSPEVLSALGCYLPPALADTLEAGALSWMAELRHVSCLFILLPPCGADDFALAQALVAEVHRCVARYGGAAQQSLCDDKGTVALGVWGKPPESHADDPCRAVAAACELADSLRAIAAAHGRDDAVSCGVTTGRAFCGNVGSARRCDWSVVGDVMNTAARLMSAAAALGAPVLCCADTAGHVRDAAREEGGEGAIPAWLCDVPMHVALKGTTQPLPVYAPALAAPVAASRRGGSTHSSPRTSVHTPRHLGAGFGGAASASASASAPASDAYDDRRGTALLGRESELARVSDLLSCASSRRGALVVISGGLSDGKSAFLRACAASASAAGLHVLSLAPAACCGAAAAPFNTTWLAAAIRRNVDSLPPHLRPLAPLLAELVPASGITAAQLATEESGEALRALHEEASDATEAMLCALATGVLRPRLGGGAGVLLCDNASALDELSATLLCALHAALAPALLLTLPRQQLEDPSSDGARLVASLSQRATSTCACVLGSLPPAAVAALCASELGVPLAALPAGLVPALRRLAGGHPLQLKESIALLLRHGNLRVERSEGASENAPASATVHAACDFAAMPDLIARGLTEESGVARMEIFVQRRLDALSPEARACVRAAAVLGGDWDLPLIARVVAASAAHATFGGVCAAAAELVHEGMWTHTSSSSAPDGAEEGGAEECGGGGGGGGGARYSFAHEVVRSLVFAATPEDTRAELHRTVLACLEDLRRMSVAPCSSSSAGGVGGGAGGGAGGADAADGAAAQPAAAWAEWGRLARGAAQHVKAASCFLTAARVSAKSVAARGVADAERFALDGIAALRAAAAAPPPDRDDPSSGGSGSGGGGDAYGEHYGGEYGAAAQQPSGPQQQRVRRVSSHAAVPRSSSVVDLTALAAANAAAAAAPAAASSAASSVSSASACASLDPACAELLRELNDTLAAVRRVQATWALVEPGLNDHALAFTQAFVGRVPEVLQLVTGKDGLSLTDPEMGPVMVAHQATLIRLVGTAVAGQKDFDALAPTLVQCGRMHARFGRTIRDFYPACGAALIDTLRGALGEEAFTPEVEAAWSAVYGFVAANMLKGIDAAERALVAERGLVDMLLGGVSVAAAS